MSKFAGMVGRLGLRRVLTLRSLSSLERIYLLWRLPTVSRLSLRLMLDPRVPVRTKAVTMGVIAWVLSPFDLPGWVPVLGQAASALVIVNVLDIFIKASPRHVVEEQIRALGLEGKYRL